MSYLIIDTSTPTHLVMIGSDQSLKFAKLMRVKPQESAKNLLSVTYNALDQHVDQFSSLQGLIVGTGPGSLSSLRTGLSLIQGLSLAHDLPIFPLPSMQWYAHAMSAQHAIKGIMMDARGGFVYQYDAESQSLAMIGADQVTDQSSQGFFVAGDWAISDIGGRNVLTSEHMPDLHASAMALSAGDNWCRVDDLKGIYIKPAVG